ncbi:hypothetical protein K493DRAFT_317833 [Basidiobolus meristosporus CBS 931.73]|uniref:Uncharacterized protein n=1 Tax=Basidiobolus meristosporus CBS 931.73 TaxID=1314790 RepID=A0A1Y1XYB6_9FUNG|nr:hypothetical protein K493DRAFT_317833 [Basidiobolus meristosporus CBS 931.73]|eukprot:ORX90645.1 hypothetical protein K493DRAFT_317833 [Basidiobolus meristosporus CBS 931.73]
MEQKPPRKNLAELRRLQKLRREQQNKPVNGQSSSHLKRSHTAGLRNVEQVHSQSLAPEPSRVSPHETPSVAAAFERAKGKQAEINPFASTEQQLDSSKLNPFTMFGKLLTDKNGQESTPQIVDIPIEGERRPTHSLPTRLAPIQVQRHVATKNFATLQEDIHESSHFKSSDESDGQESLSDNSDELSDVEGGVTYMKRNQDYMQSNHKYEINDDSKILKIPSNYKSLTSAVEPDSSQPVGPENNRSVLFNLLERQDSQLQQGNLSQDVDVDVDMKDSFDTAENPQSDDTNVMESIGSAVISQPKQGSQTPPFDWTLKARLVFTSTKSFQWCDSLVSAHQTEALDSFVKSQEPEHVNSQLKKHMHSWVYPTFENPKAYSDHLIKIMSKTSSLLAEEKESVAEFKSSIEEWKDAFRSLYYSLRNGVCTYFYYINDQFSVLFKSKNASDTGEFEAIMSKSTHGLRKVLQEEGIEFEVPLDRLSSDVLYRGDDDPIPDEERQEILRELEALEKQNPGSTFQKNTQFNWDNSYRSALYFSGHLNVHGLFDFLLNWKDSRLEYHVKRRPQLISPDPFLNAAVRSAKIVKNGKVHRIANDLPQGQESLQTSYKIELIGLFLPSSVHLLLELFKQTQDYSFEVSLATDNRTLGLNIPVQWSERPSTSDRWSRVLRESRIKVGSLKTIACTPESHFLY